jgi:hypothetical protein
MKAILEFDLPDDNDDFKLANNASNWYAAMWDLDQYLRSRIKYEDTISSDTYDALQAARDKLYEILNDRNISFD